MTAYTVGAKRKAKRDCRSRAQQQIERDEEAVIRVYEDPLATVRDARMRQITVPADDALIPMLADEAGRAIYLHAGKGERQKLWDVFCRIDAVDETYFRRIIGRPRFPAVTKMEFMPERLETRADDRPDLRTEEEKINDAANAWAIWNGYMGHLPGHQQVTIWRAVWRQDELVRDGEVTVTGQALIAALRGLADVVDRKG